VSLWFWLGLVFGYEPTLGSVKKRKKKRKVLTGIFIYITDNQVFIIMFL
jgi:hypothetical protein